MKNRYSKILLIAVVIALACALVTSCNLFGGSYEITKADVSVVQGLEENSENGTYEAQLGKSFKLSIDWHNTRVLSPKIEWYVKVGDSEEKIEGATTKILDYRLTERTSDEYEIYAVVSGKVKTNAIRITVVNAALEKPSITSASHEIVGGVIQQSLAEASDVTLVASWNDEYIDQSLQVSVKWFVDGQETDCANPTFVFGINTVTTAQSYEVSVVIGADGVDSQTSAVTLVFVNDFVLVDSVEIAMQDNASEVCEQTYYLYGLTTQTLSISLCAKAMPLESDMSKACVWTVRDANGERTVGIDEREASIDLTYGKNVVKASIDNVESRQIIIYVLQYDFDQLADVIKNNILSKFIWHGNGCDGYISNDEDLSAFMGYALSLHKIDTDFEMYLAKESLRNGDAFLEACSTALENGNDESGYFSYSTVVSGVIGKIRFTQNTVFGIPTQAVETDYVVEQANNFVRYSDQGTNKRTKLPIDDAKQSLSVSNSNELYRAVSCGYKPVFADTEEGNKLAQLYQKARDVLISYVNDDMSEREKVDAIFDWIVNEVEYDYKAAEFVDVACSYNAFYLEGVFEDKRAVCDGKSKAFSLLCGMENIRTVRIVGKAGSAGEQKNGHAWNKVLVDANGDGVREWYVVDATWGDIAFKNGDRNMVEYVNYSYYLVKDADIASTHQSDMNQPAADTDYDVFANTFVSVMGIKTTFKVTTVLQRESLVSYSRKNGNMCLCVYIAPNVQTAAYDFGVISLGNNVYILYAK